MKSTAKQIAAYVMLPRVMPRVRLLCRGNGFLASAVASSTAMLGLLPRSHSYMQPQNMGKFSVAAVFAECIRATRFTIWNADKILLLIAMIAFFVLVMTQIVLLLLSIFMGAAMASGMQGPLWGPFHTIAPEKDMAFMDAVAEHKAQADARFYSQTPVEAVESALRERSQGQDITENPIKCGIALSDSFNLNAANTQPVQAPAILNDVQAPTTRQPVHAAPGM